VWSLLDTCSSEDVRRLRLPGIDIGMMRCKCEMRLCYLQGFLQYLVSKCKKFPKIHKFYSLPIPETEGNLFLG
jgi:hypothetical protein